MTVQFINKRFCLIAVVIIGSLWASCGNSAKTEVSKTDTASIEESKTTEHEEGIELTPEQMQAIGVELGTIELKNLNDVIKASGQLAVPPQRKADVNVLMGGVIKRIYPLEGQWVKEGQILATIENTELAQIQEEYVTAKNAFSFTAAELKRQQELDEAAAGTKRKLQEAQANYNSEGARLGAMEKRLRQLGVNPATVAKGSIVTKMNVYAPISGTIGHIGVNTGTFAQPGNSLMEIIDNSQIHCDLIVYEKDLFKVKVGQKVTFILTNQNNREIVGRIYGINKSFEDESKGIIVHAIIENANTYGLIPGMYVTALVAVGNTQVTAVPVDAVVRSEGKNYIFVVDEEAKEEKSEQKKEAKEDGKEPTGEPVHFKMIEVVTGVSELGFIKITTLGEEGKNPKVVVKGANYILSKAKGGGEEEH